MARLPSIDHLDAGQTRALAALCLDRLTFDEQVEVVMVVLKPEEIKDMLIELACRLKEATKEE